METEVVIITAAATAATQMPVRTHQGNILVIKIVGVRGMNNSF